MPKNNDEPTLSLTERLDVLIARALSLEGTARLSPSFRKTRLEPLQRLMDEEALAAAERAMTEEAP